MKKYTTETTFCIAVLLVVIFAFQTDCQLFAGSETLDQFDGTSWSSVNLTDFRVRRLNTIQMGSDDLGHIYISYAVSGLGNDRPFDQQMTFTPSNNTAFLTPFFGRFAIDDVNHFTYNIERFSPILIFQCLKPIWRSNIPTTNNDLIVGYSYNMNDIVFDGESIVIVGNFLKVYSAEFAEFARVKHVAKFDGANWSSVGDGIDGIPSRIVADHKRNLVALDGDSLWRWDGNIWTAYPLELTAPSGTPQISDLDFGCNFDSVRGIPARRVATLQWNGTQLIVEEAFSGIPGDQVRIETVLAISDDELIWLGGSVNREKTVFAVSNNSWVNTGFISNPLRESDTAIRGLAFIPL